MYKLVDCARDLNSLKFVRFKNIFQAVVCTIPTLKYFNPCYSVKFSRNPNGQVDTEIRYI